MTNKEIIQISKSKPKKSQSCVPLKGLQNRDLAVAHWRVWHLLSNAVITQGLYFDEYAAQEQEDCCHLIGWIAEQPWSNGKVGRCAKYI
jgi:hypothetical protein